MREICYNNRKKMTLKESQRSCPAIQFTALAKEKGDKIIESKVLDHCKPPK